MIQIELSEVSLGDFIYYDFSDNHGQLRVYGIVVSLSGGYTLLQLKTNDDGIIHYPMRNEQFSLTFGPIYRLTQEEIDEIKAENL